MSVLFTVAVVLFAHLSGSHGRLYEVRIEGAQRIVRKFMKKVTEMSRTVCYPGDSLFWLTGPSLSGWRKG